MPILLYTILWFLAGVLTVAGIAALASAPAGDTPADTRKNHIALALIGYGCLLVVLVVVVLSILFPPCHAL
jgi:hypothetical protein